MIRESSNTNEIIDYIGAEYGKCLYIYLDICRYGLEQSFLKAWKCIDEESNITAVIMKYHTGLHVFSRKKNCDFNEIVELIKTEKPNMVCGEKECIIQMLGKLDEYKSDFGYVKIASDFKQQEDNTVVCAETADFHEMAEMLCKDYGIGSSYTVEEMSNQLKERMLDGYGRNYLLKENNQIIGQVGTGAELDEVAVISDVMVDESFRGRGVATRLLHRLCGDLAAEGKKCFLVCYNPIADKVYEKMGFINYCEWGKLYMDTK